ncbi:hypothetical protein [Streptomyces sp. NPDC097640]|uniref:hypothetical protein n=1 Tax=Streptomyces sp. NPDC097640 TaxID=3157229 RepID=UPI00332AE8A8
MNHQAEVDAAIKAKLTADYNRELGDLHAALLEFAKSVGWHVTSRRSRNTVLMDIASAGWTVAVSLSYHEGRYPAGPAAVTVADISSGVTASFDGIPTPGALTSLIAGWLEDRVSS